LCRTFTEAGYENSVRLFAELSNYDYYAGTGIEVCKLPDNAKDLAPFEKMFEYYNKTSSEFSKSLLPHLNAFHGHLVEIRKREIIRMVMTPLFEKAINDYDITAWVAAYDEIGYLAIRFLESHAIEIPGQISVIGFDDLPESQVEHLTSYNFNFESASYRILSFLLNPPSFATPGSVIEYDIEGLVIERMTTNREDTVPRRRIR
jgi:hypothetical protein